MHGNRPGGIKMLGAMVVLATGLVLAPATRGNEAVYERALPSLACVISPMGGGAVSAGSAVLVEVRRGLLLTAYHVVEGRPGVVVFFPTRDARGELITDPDYYKDHLDEVGVVGRVVASDATRDLALIHVDRVPASARASAIARRSARPGQEVFAIGNSGLGNGVLWRYRDGKVRQVYRKTIRYGTDQRVEARIVETTVPTNGGDSGGPIVNGDGELVAITTGRAREEIGVDYGIDVEEIRAMLATTLLAGDGLDTADRPPAVAPAPPAPAPPAVAPAPPAPAATALARLEEVRTVHNVFRKGRAGMEVHLKVVVKNALGRPCDVLLTICDEDRKPLTAREAEFKLPNGGLGSSARITPIYETATFPEVALFVPYGAIDAAAAPGQTRLAVALDVREVREGRWIVDDASWIYIRRAPATGGAPTAAPAD